MSKMKLDRRPPLAKSPVRLRPRRVLQSNSASMQTPPGSLTKSQKLNRSWGMEEREVRPEYHTISCELRALAKMVRTEIGNGGSENTGFANNNSSICANKSPLFERGRLYEEYSARRNERLKRKKSETGISGKGTSGYNLGVVVESAKRNSSKKIESVRKSVAAAYSVEATPRYMLRSMTKDNKKPPLPLNLDRSVLAGERKMATRRVRRI